MAREEDEMAKEEDKQMSPSSPAPIFGEDDPANAFSAGFSCGMSAAMSQMAQHQTLVPTSPAGSAQQ